MMRQLQAPACRGQLLLSMPLQPSTCADVAAPHWLPSSRPSPSQQIGCSILFPALHHTCSLGYHAGTHATHPACQASAANGQAALQQQHGSSPAVTGNNAAIRQTAGRRMLQKPMPSCRCRNDAHSCSHSSAQTCSEISCTTCMGAASFSLHTRARALPPGCILETLLSWCQSCFGVGSGRDALPAAHCGGERAHAAHELRRVLAALQRQACMHLKPPLSVKEHC